MKRRNRIDLLLLDLLILVLSFCLISVTKPYHFLPYWQKYCHDVLALAILWFPVSLFYRKYRPIKSHKPLRRFMMPILQSNLVTLGLAAIGMVIFHQQNYSNTVIIGTVINATIVEILVWNTLHFIGRLHVQPDENFLLKEMHTKKEITETRLKRVLNNIPTNSEILSRLHANIASEVGEEVFKKLNGWVNLTSPECQIVSTTTKFNIQNLPGKYKCFVNIRRINDIRYINKFFEAINEKLEPEGIFIGFLETKDLRKQRILQKYPPVLNYIMYTIDFIVKRVFPKFKLTQGIYYFFTRGQNRVLSKAEIFGRLYSCGFEVLDEVFINQHLYFLARKTSAPSYPVDPTYGPLIKLKRIGKDGKIIRVYKFRTMHPYAEYLQEYIYNKYDLQEGGKFNDDFRVSTLGGFMRRLWIDELPMLYNVLKGDMKIVGVRPLSQHYWSLYTPELQEKRKQVKPGLVPPFYADMPKTLEEIMDSEMKYLDAYKKHPLRTDLHYFFKAFYNIIFRGARSK